MQSDSRSGCRWIFRLFRADYINARWDADNRDAKSSGFAATSTIGAQCGHRAGRWLLGIHDSRAEARHEGIERGPDFRAIAVVFLAAFRASRRRSRDAIPPADAGRTPQWQGPIRRCRRLPRASGPAGESRRQTQAKKLAHRRKGRVEPGHGRRRNPSVRSASSIAALRA